MKFANQHSCFIFVRSIVSHLVFCKVTYDNIFTFLKEDADSKKAKVTPIFYSKITKLLKGKNTKTALKPQISNCLNSFELHCLRMKKRFHRFFKFFLSYNPCQICNHYVLPSPESSSKMLFTNLRYFLSSSFLAIFDNIVLSSSSFSKNNLNVL